MKEALFFRRICEFV